MDLLEVKKRLSFVWRKENDPSETYEFELAGDSWSCVRSNGAGERKFRLTTEKETGRIWWGQSYFLDPEELKAKPEKAQWYRSSDLAKKRAAFVWKRTGAALPLPEPTAPRKAAPGPAKAWPSDRQAGPSLPRPSPALAQRSQAVAGADNLGPQRRKADAPPQPEVILDVEQILVIYKPPYWKCELPDAKATAHLEDLERRGQKVPLYVLRWIRDNVSDIDAELFNEDFNPALSGTGFGPLSHRIDQETSGPLLVAKTAVAQRHLKAQFHKTEVSKRYLCLVHGRVAAKSGIVTASIRTIRTDQHTRSEVSSSGDWAETAYQVIATFGGGSAASRSRGNPGHTLVACDIKTGRTHQIRVHMSHLGHPLVADDKYQGEEEIAADRTWCPRLFLHSFRLSFRNIQNKQELVICPLPEDLKGALLSLGASEPGAHSSDSLFGETSWQHEIFRPPILAFRPGNRVVRRVAALLGDGELPTSQVNEDAELKKLCALEGLASIGKAWLSGHWRIFEAVPQSDGADLRVRLRREHAMGGVEEDQGLDRAIEAARSELEELQRQKQRAVAEEDYPRAAQIKRRAEASEVELASLLALLDSDGAALPQPGAEDGERGRRRFVEAFAEDVGDEAKFPSLVSLSSKPPPKRPSAAAGAGSQKADGHAGAAQEEDAGEEKVPELQDALTDFLSKREGCVAHINEVNNDRGLRQVMAAQSPKVGAVNKAWLKEREETFTLLRTADNEMYVALTKELQAKSAARKAGSGGGGGGMRSAAPAQQQQQRSPAYGQVVQKTCGRDDPKPLVYSYSAAERGAKEADGGGKGGGGEWEDIFMEVLRQQPQRHCNAEKLLEEVPGFGAAMGARTIREQKELLFMFLEGMPAAFRVERRFAGPDKEYLVWAK